MINLTTQIASGGGGLVHTPFQAIATLPLMQTQRVNGVLPFLMIDPVTSLVHELGHYTAARALSRPARMRINHVEIHEVEALRPAEQKLIYAAGPAANILSAAVLAGVSAFGDLDAYAGWVLYSAAVYNGAAGALNLIPIPERIFRFIPFIRKDASSDGMKILNVTRAARKNEVLESRRMTLKRLFKKDTRSITPGMDTSRWKESVGNIVASEDDRSRIQGMLGQTLMHARGTAKLSGEELRASTDIFRKRLAAGEDVEAILPEALAVCAEVMAKVLGKRPYVEQIEAAIACFMGRAVEQKTGEGKTLSIALAAYAEALSGPVDIYTSNPYLAIRDANEIGQVMMALGLTVGAAGEGNTSYLFSDETGYLRDDYKGNMIRTARRDMYQRADIIYGDVHAYVFDYLRDAIADRKQDRMATGRPMRTAIFDEVDYALLEEATTSFIIASEDDDTRSKPFRFIYNLAQRMRKGIHYTYDPKSEGISLTDEGESWLDDISETNDILAKTKHLKHLIAAAIKAARYLHINKDYIVLEDEVVIVSKNTGRIMPERIWENGLHRFVEIKEGLTIGTEDSIAAQISITNFTAMYERLSGLTGTLGSADGEFDDAFGLKTIRIPPHRNSQRKDLLPIISINAQRKIEAMRAELMRARDRNQPILIGSHDIDEASNIAADLRHLHMPHALLSGVNFGSEQDIIDAAGIKGAVTVATQLAGRGTDITPDDEALLAGGLYVFGSQLGTSKRVDDQLRGRAGRQGQPGLSRQFISPEDDIIRRFATPSEIEFIRSYASASEEGYREADRDIAALLDQIQSRSELHYRNARSSEKTIDDLLDSYRNAYFAIRNAILEGHHDHSQLGIFRITRLHTRILNPLKRTHILRELERSWKDFLKTCHEMHLERDSDLDIHELSDLFRTAVIAPFKKTRWSLGWVKTGIKKSYEFVEEYLPVQIAELAIRKLIRPAMAKVLDILGRTVSTLGLHRTASLSTDASIRLKPTPYNLTARARSNADSNPDAAIDDTIEIVDMAFERLEEDDDALGIAMDAIALMADIYHMKGERFEAKGRYIEATFNYNIARTLFPEDAKYLQSFKRMAIALGPETRKALPSLPPGLANAYLFLARTKCDDEKYDKARRYFDRVIAINPASATAYFGRSSCKQKLGNTDGARLDVYKGILHMLYEREEFSNVREAYAALHNKTMSVNVLHDIAERAASYEAPSKSCFVKDYRKAAPHYEAAQRLYHAGKYENALQLIDAAISFNNTDKDFFGLRADIHFELGNYEESLSDSVDALRFEIGNERGILKDLIAGHNRMMQWKLSSLNYFFESFKKALVNGG